MNSNAGTVRQKPVILTVDDDPNNLAVIHDCLAECDYTLLVAEDGESALVRAEFAKPDIILLDIMMPGMDGYETCERLKTSAVTRNIPVIFMSALAETGHKVRGLEAGAVDYITKPFQREELLARLAVHLQIRDLTSRLREANETLERRVQERTTDLAHANNELEEEIAERQTAQEQLQEQALILEEKIDELERTQGALQKSERKLRAIFNQTFQLMGILSPEGIMLEANQTALDFCGMAEAEVINRPFWDGPWWSHSAELRDKVRDAVHRAIAGEFVRFETTHRDSHGALRYIDFSIKQVVDEQGTVMLLIPEGRDITATKNMEKELRQAQKMEAVGTLAAGIAHDFNNILMAITGFTEMSLMRIEENSPVSRQLHQVHEAGMRAAELVRQILTFARQREQEMKPVPLGVVVKEVLKLLRSTLPTTIDIRQDISAPDAKHLVMADPTQMHQVLMNLGTNAAHAMGARGGTLSVALERVELDQGYMDQHHELMPGEYVRLSVSDTGSGMDTAVMERIFDPYFTTKPAGEGTGLGLAVVMGIVRNHGGAITVSSQPGQGTTFHVFLPLVHGEIAEQPVEEILPTGAERILFIDDEKTLAFLGREMLETLGYSVVSTHSSIHALELFKENPERFDLVITDLTMPGLTGLELAREIQGLRNGLPVIFCTGYYNMQDDLEGLHAISCDSIQKPYVMASLAKTVRKALDRQMAEV